MQYIEIEKLTLLKNNPRKIKKEELEKLKRDINNDKEFLELRPILVNEHDGILEIYAGNQRFKAAQELGWDKVPVDIGKDLDNRLMRKRAYIDNVRYGGWDYELMIDDRDILEELSLPEFKDFLKKNPGKVVEDEPPAISEDVKSKLGEIYQFGKHRIMCGDSTKKENIEALMDGKKADLCLMDPPYGMGLDTDFSRLNSGNSFKSLKSTSIYRKVIGDNEDFKPELITTIFDNFGYCKDIYLFGFDYYAELIPNRKKGSILVWNKRADKEEKIEKVGDGFTLAEFELIWSKNKRRREILDVIWFGMVGLQFEGEIKNGQSRRVHPNQKPTRLLKMLIPDDSQLTVDLYLGSGSTLIACEQKNVACYGMELDPQYVDVIRKRWAKFVYPDTWAERWEELTPKTLK